MDQVREVLRSISLLLCSPFRRQQRRRIRMIMRGHRYLKNKGRLHIIEDTVQHLREFQLQIPHGTLPKFLWSQSLESAELVIRQRLSARYPDLTRSLLAASSTYQGKVVSPFPSIWLDQLHHFGFRVDHRRSALLWNVYLLKCFGYGILKSILILKSSFSAQKAATSCAESYIYFSDLRIDNIPSSFESVPSNCIVNWYCRWQGRSRDVKSLRHSAPTLDSRTQHVGSYYLSYQPTPIPALSSRKNQIAFILYFLICLFHQFSSCFTGRWWNILLFHEFIESLHLRLESNLVAKEYWFHNSRMYPPLWVYELPLMRSKCIYYFYSTNVKPFVFRDDGSLPFVTPYSIMNWPQYLVWDQYQRSFVKQCHKNCLSIRVVGPIYFSDQANHSSLPTNFDPSRSIAVFDVQPFRSSIYQVFGFASDFYIPDQCIRFVSDILVCAAEFDVTILLKSKREIGSRSHPKYRLFLDSLSSHDNVVFIDPAVSAYRLVESCVGSVSMPYTSTAIIFRQAGVPSIYYAPLLSPHVDPSPTHGIQLVQHPYNLRSWISSLISSNLASNS